jgi:hypothetical protein
LDDTRPPVQIRYCRSLLVPALNLAFRCFAAIDHRLFTPPFCESCESSKTEVATRTDYVLYIRCWACGHVWSVPKPECAPVGS